MYQANIKDNIVTNLQNILKLKISGLYSEAIKEIAKILELVLEDYYKRTFPLANASEKQKLLDVEKKFSKKQSPVDTLGLGRWINFYQQSNMANLLTKYFNFNATFFDYKKFSNINTLRNKCTHDNYEASVDEISEVYDYLITFLKDTNLIVEEPVAIGDQTIIEKEIPKTKRWADNIRLFLANNPVFEINEDFYGRSSESVIYPVQIKWEFVGIIHDTDRIHLFLLESEADYHEHVMEDVHIKISNQIEEILRQKFPEIKEMKIQINIYDSIDDIEKNSWMSFEIDL